MMGRIGGIGAPCLVVILAVVGTAAGQEPAPRPLRVRAQLSRGPYYVGQSLALEVSAIAEGERPRIVPPKVTGAEVTPTGTDLKPISSSGIGDVVFEHNLFVWRFRVLPRRAGRLSIPPIAVRLGARSGTTEAIRATVQKLPDSGRTDAFLGGVGPFEVAAEARPATVRLGGVVEYCLRVTGPAARGMSRAPDPRALIRGSSGLEVKAGPVEAVADPPSRLFCYRVRPTRAGDFVLPPVPVSAFDPRVGRYVTKVSPGVPVHVVEVERFDPATLDYAPPASAWDRWLRAAVASVAGIVLIGAGTAGWLSFRRALARRRRERAPGRYLARLIRGLDRDAATAAEAGRSITEGLAGYLNMTIGRPPGALTPREAREGIARVSRDERLGEDAAVLVARCDRAQFGGAGPSAVELAGEARRLFLEMVRRDERRGFETPREAAGTAAT